MTSQPLTILHVVISDRFAGVEQFVLRLAVMQARTGHRVHVAGGAPARMRVALVEAGATWEPLRQVHDLPGVLRRHARRADVVNTHMTDADVAAALLLGRHGPALVSTRHFAQTRRRFGPVRADWIVRRHVDSEIAISTAVAEATGIPSTVVHSGVPAAPPRASRSGAGARRVIMVQRLQREKHTDIGVRAFAASRLAERGWRLDIAGEGPQRDALHDLISDLDLSGSVRLLGFRDDVPALLASSALFLAPCPVEGLGLAVLEAMSAGVAPVVCAAAGHRDLLDGLDARAGFREGDVEDAADALRTFATDEQRRDRLGAAARERAAGEFSLDRQAERTEQVYRDAIARRRLG